MKTYMDCVPCFFGQAVKAARIAGADESLQKKITDKIAKIMIDFPLQFCPPEMGAKVYNVVREKTRNDDPFKKIKEKSNELALKFLPQLKAKIKKSDDRLFTALKISILGNIIDYGVNEISASLNIEEEINQIINSECSSLNLTDTALFNYSAFNDALKKTKKILFLGDNAGEIVFDRLLIEELKGLNKEIIYVVRDGPIINDVLLEDAYTCGIDKFAQVISSGVSAPGTILKFSSNEFMDIYNKSGLVISKGQGNFEALSEENKSIFFLFRVKCLVVANYIGCRVGEEILKSNIIKNDEIYILQNVAT